MTKTNTTNSDEDKFNESLITLPNRQSDTSIQKSKPKQQVVALIGVSLDEKWANSEQICLVTNYTVTILPYHIIIISLKPLNCTAGINIQPNTLLKMEEELFLSFWTTRYYSTTSTAEIRAENTWQFYGCTMESKWSYHNFKEKHYQWLHKSVRLYRKIPDWPTRK